MSDKAAITIRLKFSRKTKNSIWYTCCDISLKIYKVFACILTLIL